MPMVPMNIDSSTVAITSTITAVIIFFFATIVGQIKPAAALAIAVIVGFILYAMGVVPIGLLFVVGISMIVAIFKTTASASTSSEPSSEKKRRRALGYVDSQQQPNSMSLTVSRTIACPSCKVDLLSHNAEELQCRCPQCKTTFRLDSGGRIYDINKLEQPAKSSDAKAQATHKDQQLIAARQSSATQTHEQFNLEKRYQSKTPEGTMKQNLYQILGVPQNASQSVLNVAYKELIAKHQTSHNQGAQDTSNELVFIKWAYEHLSNSDKRAAYNVKLEMMPAKPRIVHPTSKVPSQSAKESKLVNENTQTDIFVMEPESHQVGTPTVVPAALKSHPSENEVWTQTVLYFVHEPMVVFKCGRYPTDKIINQFPANERRKIKESIDAVVELGFFVMDGSDIQLTDKGEMLFQALVEASQKSADERLKLTKTSPKFAAILTAIQRDNRLSPPSDLPASIASQQSV